MTPFRTPPCPVCSAPTVIWLDRLKLARWQGGEHVQDVWPDWTADKRELLITGTHPKCWEQMFPEEEEESEALPK